MDYRLLDEFRGLFEGTRYLHRDSSRGDWVAMHLFEDLVSLAKSPKLQERVAKREVVLNVQNRRRGVDARRGDGTMGEIIPHVEPITDEGFLIARGQIATVEIGVEVKILMKAMIKQIDRVKNDLENQVRQFRRGGGQPICLAIAGINHSGHSVTYEGAREYRTDGKSNRHPIQEAVKAEERILKEVRPAFDEILILRFRATNEPPHAFEWVDANATRLDYGAILTRVSRLYDMRF